MKRIFLITMLIGAMACSKPNEKKEQGNYTVMTYNIRYDNTYDKKNNWDLRKEAVIQTIKKQNPDILGTQEALVNQKEYLNASLPAYDYVGVGREDGVDKGEFVALFFKKDKFNVLDSGTFWLSESPDSISVGWDAALERITTYALLEDKANGQKIWVLNAHFDHVGQSARVNAVHLILEKIKDFKAQSNSPVLFMGDLNASPTNSAISLLKTVLNDSYVVSEIPFQGVEATYNDFNVDKTPERRIDYIFVDKFNVKNYENIIERLDNGNYVSDHFPVFVTVEVVK